MPAASVIAFHEGRKALVVDAAHMRNGYAMRVLNAVGYDARGQMYVVASALVSGEENNENVRWFLRELLCGGINTPSFIMSDRGSALLSSVAAVYPSKCMFIIIITIKIISSAPPPPPPCLYVGAGVPFANYSCHGGYA